MSVRGGVDHGGADSAGRAMTAGVGGPGVAPPRSRDQASTAASAEESPTCPGMSPAEEAAWFGLLRVIGALSKALDAELTRAHRLPLRSFEALFHLSRAEGGGLGMGDLARALQLSLSGLSRLVDRLEEDGLLRREASATDARAVRVGITDAGVRHLHAAAQTHVELVRARFLSHFTAADLALLGEFLGRIETEPACS